MRKTGFGFDELFGSAAGRGDNGEEDDEEEDETKEEGWLVDARSSYPLPVVPAEVSSDAWLFLLPQVEGGVSLTFERGAPHGTTTTGPSM